MLATSVGKKRSVIVDQLGLTDKVAEFETVLNIAGLPSKERYSEDEETVIKRAYRQWVDSSPPATERRVDIPKSTPIVNSDLSLEDLVRQTLLPTEEAYQRAIQLAVGKSKETMRQAHIEGIRELVEYQSYLASPEGFMASKEEALRLMSTADHMLPG